MREALWQNLRYAARSLRRTPGFTATVLVTLGLSMGAATTIFSVVDAVLIKPLPYSGAERLVVIHEVLPTFSQVSAPVNAVHFEEWRSANRSFDALALVNGISMNLTGTGEPERVQAARVSPVLFRMLGVVPQLGRVLRDDEDHPGRDRVVVLSDTLWRRRFGADPRVVGKHVMLDGQPYDVVGVLPPSFRFPRLNQLYPITIADDTPQIWKPFALTDMERSPFGDFNSAAIGRLRGETSVDAARADLDRIQAAFASRVLPGVVEMKAAVTPLQDQVTGRTRNGLRMLAAAVALVLLIACANVTNLLIGRAVVREHEFAVRSAIGASRGRLACHVFAESFLLACGGAAIGVYVAWGATSIVRLTAPVDLTPTADMGIDVRVFAFTLASSAFVACAVGLFPAWRVGRGAAIAALGRTTRFASRARLHRLLVTVEIALTAVCLVATGLLLHSLIEVLRVGKGFDVQRLLTVELRLPATRYSGVSTTTRFIDAAITEISALPDVSATAVSNMLPLHGEGANNSIFVEGAPADSSRVPPAADIRIVNPAYFATLGIPLMKGLVFDSADRQRRGALVSANTAARLWPGEDPTGKRFSVGRPDGPRVEVIGVVGDIHGASLEKAPALTIYFPYWLQVPGNRTRVSIAVRTAKDAQPLGGALAAAIHRVDAGVGVPPPRTMEQVVENSVALRRFQTNLVVLFGGGALLLAMVGIYGVVAYLVAQRTKEIGVRMALGARRNVVLRFVVGDALRLLGHGLAAGVPAALIAASSLRSLLFAVVPEDALTFALVGVVLVVTTITAAIIPACRASRVDPVIALRAE